MGIYVELDAASKWPEEVAASALSQGQSKTTLLLLEVRGRRDVDAFLKAHKAEVDQALSVYGGVLFRGFDTQGAQDLMRVADSVLDEPMVYRDRASPRSQVEGFVFTSTDAASHLHIRMHCESSFTHRWPSRILFQCVKPSRSGGATPIADVREVYKRISEPLRRRLEESGISYVRHFGSGPGMDFRDVFQVKNEDELRRYCKEAGIHIGEMPDGKLRLWQTRPALAVHPKTNEKVWFNHACTLHVSLLESGLRDALRAQYGESSLPHNTYAGDGSLLSDGEVEELYAAYEAEILRFDWQAGDVLLLDNMLMAHGRDPYEGNREVVVAMGDPLTWDDVTHSGMQGFSPDCLESIDSKKDVEKAGEKAVFNLSEEALLQILLEIVREALEQPELTASDDFFEFGGDSVIAAKVVQEVEEKVGLTIPLDLFFDTECIRDWARELTMAEV